MWPAERLLRALIVPFSRGEGESILLSLDLHRILRGCCVVSFLHWENHGGIKTHHPSLWSALPPSFPTGWLRKADGRPGKLALEPSISNPLHGKEKKSYYAPYRLLSGVHTFSVLNRGTLEFGPRALAVCCERRALGGA